MTKMEEMEIALAELYEELRGARDIGLTGEGILERIKAQEARIQMMKEMQ